MNGYSSNCERREKWKPNCATTAGNSIWQMCLSEKWCGWGNVSRRSCTARRNASKTTTSTVCGGDFMNSSRRFNTHPCNTCGRTEFEDSMLEYNDRFYCSLICKQKQERKENEELREKTRGTTAGVMFRSDDGWQGTGRDEPDSE